MSHIETPINPAAMPVGGVPPMRWTAVLHEAFRKLAPRVQLKNPVMFVVYLGSIVTTVQAAGTGRHGRRAGRLHLRGRVLAVVHRAVRECGRGARRRARQGAGRCAACGAQARVREGARRAEAIRQHQPSRAERRLAAGSIVLVEAGDTIPADGEVIDGVASVDESAITGESAPVIRESGGDFSSVTGGTRVLSDWIIVKITAQPGEAFLDRMIAMVEGAKRGKTPNEVALTILLVALTIIFLLVCVTLLPFSQFSVLLNASGTAVSLTVLIALLVCLIPTTIGALLSAIGIAG